VTWRAGANAPKLRGYYPDTFIREAIAGANRSDFAVVEYSIQSNHLHMLIEATSKRALERGMRRLARRIVARMKTKFAWKGKLFTRYHSRALSTPREVRNALRYVLLNMRHHVAAPGVRLDPTWLDPYSSGYWFDGWKYPIIGNHELVERLSGVPRPTAIARTWLLSVGWRRWGLLGFDEVPR
jgi:REP element-mobilizing transposase RayT